MEDEKVEIALSIKKSTLKRIEEICEYYNMHIKFNNKEWTPLTVENFIKGTTVDEVDRIESYYNLANYEKLGKPYGIKNRFKEIMLEKGLRQKDLVEMTGLDKSHISTILLNKNQPTIDSFFRVWVALECPDLYQVLYRESE